MRAFFFVILVSLFLTACNPVIMPQSRPDDLTFQPLEFNFPDVAHQELDNGMKIYLRENHELPLVKLTVMVEGGSIYDPQAKTGLSDFFAEVLQSGGSVGFPAEQLEAELEMKAIDFSVSSSSYCYEINMSLHRDDLDRGLDILADLLQRPAFASERMELVRKQMLNDLKRMNDEPGSIARRMLARSINPGHPFGSFPDAAGINSFSRADLIDLHQKFFNPKNIWVAASGDISAAEIPARFAEIFKDWPVVSDFVRDFPSLPMQPQGKILLADKKVPQTTILMGHSGISKDNPDVMALQVANYILGGGGFNSRLMREIRSNRGLAYSVYSYFQVGRHLPGLFIAGSETKSRSTTEVVLLMRKLMQQLVDQPVSAAELELAQKSLINSFVFAFDDSHAIVSRRMRLDYYGYPEDYLSAYRKRVAAVTVDDVQRVARKYLQPDKLQVVLVGNSSSYRDSIKAVGLPVESVTPGQE